jgi:hypothetical protein
MNCANHVDIPATAYCRTCGKPVCATCARDVRGVIFCEDCLAAQVSGAVPPNQPPGYVAPGAQPVSGGGSPGLAAMLGLIPGVGAMYNGEYAKGFIHVLILGTLIWLVSNVHGGLEPIFGLAIAAFVIYMPFEAYQTAKAHQMGLPGPDPFGLNNLVGKPPVTTATTVPPAGTAAGSVPVAAAGEPVPMDDSASCDRQVPIGAIVLIGLGVLFLLNTFGWLHFDWIWRFWPLILIAIGVRVLMRRNRLGY